MNQLLSNGTPEEVAETCRQAIRDAYPGYFMGSTTEADNSCKTENLVAMYQVAMKGISLAGFVNKVSRSSRPQIIFLCSLWSE
jgi:hypothetical protein